MGTDLQITADLVRRLRAGACLIAGDGRVLASSLAAAEAFGWPGGCPEGARLHDLVTDDDAERTERALGALFEGRDIRADLRANLRLGDPGDAPVRLAFEAVRDGDRTIAVLVDISGGVAGEIRAEGPDGSLVAAHERLRHLTDSATVGLFEARWQDDGGVEFPNTTARFDDLVGCSRAELDALGPKILARIHPGDLARLREAVAASQRDRAPLQLRFRLLHPARGTIWLEVSATAPRREDGGFAWVAALHDVTAEVRRERDLVQARRVAEQMRARNERLALHDGLTGLPNRRYFDEVLAARMLAARLTGPRDCTLIRLDLDRFRHVNDTLGHAAGDRVLERVAEVLRAAVRPDDFASRNGGDEFSVLMAPGSSLDEAEALVDRVQRRLATPLIHDGRQCRFGVSFGIAESANILGTGADIHLFADAALERAKTEGGNRAKVFSPRLHSRLLTDRRLAVELHDALEHDQLVPFFQPQISAADGRLHGAEVLLRWDHPTDGILAPDAFLHVAEQLRLVPDIDRVVMEKSRDVLLRWRARGLVVPKISFNVSAGRMHDPAILSAAARFAETGAQVTFELLESILVEEEGPVFRDNLAALRATGIDIEIDDFGSGHASIIGLMEIEPSALKIDQRIVFPVVDDPRARELVRAIVDIARALGIGTVAEGVESAAHARILRDLGCDVLQGFHYARPLDEGRFLDFASARTGPAD